MLCKRIIPCLDVRDGKVVKGKRFRDHEVLGEIEELAIRYRDEGADELVFYDITASSEGRKVDKTWVARVARVLNIPFCVAGGIRDAVTACEILASGADKISINSPALENPSLIDDLAARFGSQCVVVGVDSLRSGNHLEVYCYTGKESTTRPGGRSTLAWLREVQERGAGEVVLNCMNQDGTGEGYDLEQLLEARRILRIPLVASGGAARAEHFEAVFARARVDGALAAGAFHRGTLSICGLKRELRARGVEVRI